MFCHFLNNILTFYLGFFYEWAYQSDSTLPNILQNLRGAVTILIANADNATSIRRSSNASALLSLRSCIHQRNMIARMLLFSVDFLCARSGWPKHAETIVALLPFD